MDTEKLTLFACLSTFYFKSLLFAKEWFCILVFMNAHFVFSLQTKNDAVYRMQPNHSSEVYVSLIQRELAVLNKKIAKLCSVNRQLITQTETSEEKKPEHEFVLSVDSLSALLLILYTLLRTLDFRWTLTGDPNSMTELSYLDESLLSHIAALLQYILLSLR